MSAASNAERLFLNLSAKTTASNQDLSELCQAMAELAKSVKQIEQNQQWIQSKVSNIR